MAFYAVAKGHKVGIYKKWRVCEKMVKDFVGARYKKFETRKAAQEFIGERKTSKLLFNWSMLGDMPSTLKAQFSQKIYPVSSNSVTTQTTIGSVNDGSLNFSHSFPSFKADVKGKNNMRGKKRKHDNIAQENHSSADIQVINVVGSRSSKKRKPITGPSVVSEAKLAKIPVVYTDGACSNNGKKRGKDTAKAGYGVFWGDGHPDNTSAPVQGTATNNRAEYTAVIVALQQAIRNNFAHIVLRTDSMLLINSLTLWRNSWKRNNWKKKDGTEVLNLDLLKQLDSLLEKIFVTFEHVRAHIGIYGNEMADKLARQGAKLYQASR